MTGHLEVCDCDTYAGLGFARVIAYCVARERHPLHTKADEPFGLQAAADGDVLGREVARKVHVADWWHVGLYEVVRYDGTAVLELRGVIWEDTKYYFDGRIVPIPNWEI